MVNNKCEEVLYVAEESDNCLSNDKVVWLKMCHIQLLESDRKALLTFGYQLNDKHINLAQKLLRNKFPDIEGLTSTLSQSKDCHQKIRCGLQVIFCHGNHWITASNLNEENVIMVYDSVYASVSDKVRETICKLFHCTNNTHISLASMQKQEPASNNCGIFTIVAATAIANSCNPSLLHFIEKEMRKHLFDCFENNIITTFPCHDT